MSCAPIAMPDSPDEPARTAAIAFAARMARAGKLSLFWSDRACTRGRFPPLDRLDYIDRPQPLFERARVACPRPSLAEIRTYLGGAPFANWVERSRGFAEADSLAAGDRKPFIRQLLYPARLV